MFQEIPIKFKPRKGHEIDERLYQYTEELDITFPIVVIRNELYLVGSERLNIKLNANNNQLLVRVGGGYKNFEEHILAQNKFYQRMLVMHMIKSGESLEWVVEMLIAGKKIPNQLLDL